MSLQPLMDDSVDFDSLVPIVAYEQIGAALGVDWRRLLADDVPSAATLVANGPQSSRRLLDATC